MAFGFVFVHPQSISGPESFIAEAAWKDNSLEMVCFNVIFYLHALAFLSTHFAPISFAILICTIVLPFFRHRFHPLFKFI